ncbi:hypothetical protein MHU86_14004 [Fragilaria crotonensis]|nr:hypothetical protein MHU86_14004 [Fragilaria crotonensis]
MGLPVILEKDHLNKVHAVEKARELNSQRHVGSEEHEVVVEEHEGEVKHAVGGVDLGRQLTNLDGGQNHGDTGGEEVFVSPFWQTENRGSLDGRSHQVDDGDNQNDEVLTSDDETLHVVALVRELGIQQGTWIGFGILFFIDRLL